jgi:hypothetical protein
MWLRRHLHLERRLRGCGLRPLHYLLLSTLLRGAGFHLGFEEQKAAAERPS